MPLGHAVAGIGAGGYDKPYFAQRTTAEDIRQPHSLPLEVLAELGIAGALLLAAGLALIATGAWRRIRAGLREPVVVAALGVVTAWFVHTSVDWMHLLPGLTGVALLGAADMFSVYIRQSLIQLHTPDAMRGRVMSIFMLAFRGGMPLGNLLAGVVAQRWSISHALAVNGGVLAVVALIFILRRTDLDSVAASG